MNPLCIPKNPRFLQKSLSDIKKITANSPQDIPLIAQESLHHSHQINSITNSFISLLDPDTQFDSKISGSLKGIPISIKDNFCSTLFPTTAGSQMLKNYQSPYNSTVVQNLIDSGCIIIGTTNMDEFGMGAHNKFSAFGPAYSPFGEHQSPGGSSGGSAISVATNAVFASIGTDTGGSVRVPAAFNGIVGFKPSYGIPSRFGVVAFSSSLDTPGFFARNVQDCSLIFQAALSIDTNDSTCIVDQDFLDDLGTLQSPLENPITFAIPTEYKSLVDNFADTEIEKAFYSSIDKITKAGHSIVNVSLKYLDYSIPTYLAIVCAESSSNLARYDGLKYGSSTFIDENNSMDLDLEQLMTRTRDESFGPEVKRRILAGTMVLSQNSYDKFYKKALQMRRCIVEDFASTFHCADFILSPTTLIKPPEINENQGSLNFEKDYLMDSFTSGPSLAGLPSISIPFEKSNPNGGLQIVGNRLKDRQVLSVSQHLEELIYD